MAAGPGNRSGSDCGKIEKTDCVLRSALMASSLPGAKSHSQTEFPPQTNLVELTGMELKTDGYSWFRRSGQGPGCRGYWQFGTFLRQIPDLQIPRRNPIISSRPDLPKQPGRLLETKPGCCILATSRNGGFWKDAWAWVAISAFKKGFDGIDPADEGIHGGGEAESDVARCPEGVAADECDVCAFEECGAEVGGILDRGTATKWFSEVAADIKEDVEGAAWFSEGESGDGAESVADVVSAANEFAAHFGDAVLGAIESGECGVLGDAAGVGGLLTLEAVDSGADVFGGKRPADTPAGHGVGFADAVDDDGAFADFFAEGCEGAECVTGEDEFFVDFVGEDDDVFFDGDIGELLQGINGIDTARGVTGAVEHEHAGAGGDGVAELIGGEAEAVLFAGFDEHGAGADEFDECGVADPVGGGNDDFVARIAAGCEHVVQAVFSAIGDGDFGRFVGDTMIAAEGIADGLPKFLDASGGRIASVAGVHGCFCCVTDVLWGDEVGFADGEFEHIDAASAKFACLGGGGQSFGGLEGIDKGGCVHGTLAKNRAGMSDRSVFTVYRQDIGNGGRVHGGNGNSRRLEAVAWK